MMKSGKDLKKKGKCLVEIRLSHLWGHFRLGSQGHVMRCVDKRSVQEIIIIMVIFKCYFSGELIALS